MDDNIVNESLYSLDKYLDRLIPGIEEIIKCFSEDKEGEALKLLIEAIEGINWCIKVVILTKPTLETYDIEVDEKKIKDLLLEFENALKNEDYVYVNDLLEYEMLDLFTYWKKGISNVSFTVN
ncbi:hypothetical protein GOQ27_06680 [Clostridium sp. D2Q-11]|uniref:DUF8042 domain-containing protein n=1 Tax=Anaeromonas frigoriresistens TaxID=2683708 RepID=A0A942UUB5_9FIRM|nr:hypothetical protein [Anaeromonas frigoriresistens]MBS4538140.1 hypothetical protein [Anaeromonas frigoriresistens]